MAVELTRWSFMREWWRVLQLSELLEVSTTPLRGSQQFAYRSLTVLEPLPGRRSKKLWLQQRDALELVFLQLTADRYAFMEMAREFGLAEEGTETVWSDFHTDEFVPCFTEIRVSDQNVVGKDPHWPLWILSAVLTPEALKDRSRRFRATRSKILNMVDASMRVVCERFTIPISIGVWFSSHEVATAVLHYVSDSKIAMDALLATAVNDPTEEDRRSGLRVFPFRVEFLDITIDRMQVTSSLQTAIDRAVSTPGLQLRALNFSFSQKLSKQTFGNLVRKLVVGATHNSLNANLDLSHDVMRHRKRTLTPTQLVQVLSALLGPSRFSSICIQKVLDDCTPSDRRWVWLWLVHALFSSSAVHSITFFQLHIKCITDADIAACQDYLRSRNPVTLLCHPSWTFGGGLDPEAQPPKRVSLAKGARILLNPSRRRDPEPVMLPASGWYDVIQEDDEFVDVVVPAYGQCRMLKCEVNEWRILPHCVPQSRFVHHPVESLKVWVGHHSRAQRDPVDEGSVLAMFLELVGQPVISLGVSCRALNSNAFLDSIWASSPHLQMLQALSVELSSFAYLLDAYESERCRVPSLQFSNCHVHESESVIAFTDALGDPTKKIFRVLREWSFGEHYHHFIFADDDFEDFARMLSKNSTLRYFSLDVDASELPKYQHLFTPYHSQVLDGQSQLLPVECKCAFLSVVDHSNTPDVATMLPAATAIAKLDSCMLSVIFQFSVRPVRRTVVLRDI